MNRERMEKVADDLKHNFDMFKKELERSYEALYKACADLISITYPKNGEDVDELVNKYLDDEQ